jgi:hypothetical protein
VALVPLRIALDLALGDNKGTAIVDSVQSVAVEQKTITVQFRPVPHLKERLQNLKTRLRGLRDDMALLGDPMAVRTYYAKLIELVEKSARSRPVSMAHFVGPVFQLAQRRSRAGNPVDENQAAVLALAMYFGDWRFGRLIGPVLTEEMKRHRPRTRGVQLGGRRDLRLHFIISAGLKIVADSGVTVAIGEFKELLDAGRGGSGFSFADLAADRAGVRFAEVATDRSGGAESLQSLFAGEAGEESFFPRVAGLPEGIPREEFERRFGTVESPEYRALVREIDHRIRQLPAYGNSAGAPRNQG